jgi:hypothetical protein
MLTGFLRAELDGMLGQVVKRQLTVTRSPGPGTSCCQDALLSIGVGGHLPPPVPRAIRAGLKVTPQTPQTPQHLC